MTIVAGVDGCRGGWVVVRAESEPFALVGIEVVDAIASLLDERLELVAIDMPIGLPSSRARTADRAARRLLGPRRSSVFPTPARAVLDATDHADACERSRRAIGVGVSIQAWNLVPKIRELDAAMTPARQGRVRETHPELAFARLAGAPMADPKRSPAGFSARRAALGLDVSDVPRVPGAAADDILDAIALVHSARAVLDGSATVLGDGERDERGLLMEIWG